MNLADKVVNHVRITGSGNPEIEFEGRIVRHWEDGEPTYRLITDYATVGRLQHEVSDYAKALGALIRFAQGVVAIAATVGVRDNPTPKSLEDAA